MLSPPAFQYTIHGKEKQENNEFLRIFSHKSGWKIWQFHFIIEKKQEK